MAKFQKGQSGNPGGRPKMPLDVRKAAQAYTNDAMKALGEIVKDKKATKASRVAAATVLLDRGYGKPTQHIEANVSILDKMTDDERSALEAALALVAGEQGDATDGTRETTH